MIYHDGVLNGNPCCTMDRPHGGRRFTRRIGRHGATGTQRWPVARYTLSGQVAQQHAEQVCVRLPGCQSLKLDAGYDWRNATRRVIYHLQLNGDGIRVGSGVGIGERNQLATTLPQLVREETSGLLHWTLGAPAVLDVAIRSGSPTLPHPTLKPHANGGHTWS